MLPFVEEIGGAPDLSPARSPRRPRLCFLLHGLDDNVIPSVETVFAAEYLRVRAIDDVRLLRTPLISHADLADGPEDRGHLAADFVLDRNVAEAVRRCRAFQPSRLWAFGSLSLWVFAPVSAPKFAVGQIPQLTGSEAFRDEPDRSVYGPSRSTGCAMASHIMRTWRLRPSRIVISRSVRDPARDWTTRCSRTLAGSVRWPSITMPRRSRSRSRSSGTPSTSASYVRSSS